MRAKMRPKGSPTSILLLGWLACGVCLASASARAAAPEESAARLAAELRAERPAGGAAARRSAAPHDLAVATAPAGSQLVALSGNAQQLVPGVSSQPLVVALTDPAGRPLAQEAVLWEVISPPRGVVVVGGSELVAVPLSAGAVTFTSGSGRTENRVQILLPISATVRASVRGSSLSVDFTLGAALDNLGAVDTNQRAVAASIDHACPALVGKLNAGTLDAREGDLLGRCSDMIFAAASNPDAVANALDQVTSEEIPAGQTLAVEVPDAQLTNVRARLSALRSGVHGVSVRGLALDFGGRGLSGDWVQPLFDSFWQQATGNDDPLLGSTLPRVGFFLNGRVGTGRKDATTLEEGFAFDSGGLTGGVDYRVHDTVVLGLAAGFTRSKADFDGGEGKLDAKDSSATAYMTAYSPGGGYLDAAATFGKSSNQLDRRIRYTLPAFDGSGPVSVDQVASADPDGNELSSALEVGWDLSHGGFTFAPFLRGTYSDVTIDAYRETMSDPSGPGSGLALDVEEQSFRSVTATAGFDLTWALSQSWGVVMPQMRGEYHKQFEDKADPVAARFVFDPTATPFLVSPDSPDTTYGVLGGGLSLVLSHGVSGFVFYDQLLGLENLSSHSISFGVRVER